MSGPNDQPKQIEGTLLVVGAACVFALVALVVKKDPMPVLLATECRFLVSWVVAVAFMLLYRRQRALYWFGPPASRKWLVLKCASSFFFINLWWKGIQLAPVGDCIAIIYTSPIFTSILSWLLLKEPLLPQFPLQILLVLLGTLLVLDPPALRWLLPSDGTEEEKPRDYTYVFLALAVGCICPIVTRQTRECSWIEVEHVSAALAAAVLCPAMLLVQSWLSGVFPHIPTASRQETFLIVLAALGSFVGIAMETKGYQLAEVGKASMFRYVEVPFAYFLQLVATKEAVRVQALVGSVLIIASCFLGLELPIFGKDQKSEITAPLLRIPGTPPLRSA